MYLTIIIIISVEKVTGYHVFSSFSRESERKWIINDWQQGERQATDYNIQHMYVWCYSTQVHKLETEFETWRRHSDNGFKVVLNLNGLELEQSNLS